MHWFFPIENRTAFGCLFTSHDVYEIPHLLYFTLNFSNNIRLNAINDVSWFQSLFTSQAPIYRRQ